MSYLAMNYKENKKENKKDDPHYKGLFWCHVHKAFYRWDEFIKISRRIDKGERI